MSSMSEKFYASVVDNEVFGNKLYDGLSEDRKKTIDSIRRVSDYENLNIYEMTVYYDYKLEEATKAWETQPDTTELMQHLIEIAIPGANIPYKAPNYGCSALCYTEDNEDVSARLVADKIHYANADNADSKSSETLQNKPQTFMGRNYDFKFDSSAMCVRCNPKNGYRSISFSGLDHVYDNDPLINNLSKVMTLTCPLIPLDGMNEKGLCVTVLTLDSEPTIQRRGKGVLIPGTLIRILLDKAATTKEAVDILKNYDIFSISGRDYHYYITDASADSRVVEYDCNSAERKMVVTPTQSITNFYKLYENRVKPNQHNGIYGHGKERYDAINKVLTDKDIHGGRKICWQALKAAAQTPREDEVTSNTQWSALYNTTTLEVEFSLHRIWNDIFKFKL